MEDNLKRIQVNLKKGNFFNYGEKYYVNFSYFNKEQSDYVKKIMDELVKDYGAPRLLKSGKEYIMPYLVDAEGRPTGSMDAQVVGGCAIPKNLLAEFIKRFVEFDKMAVSVGDTAFIDKFNISKFNSALVDLDNNLENDGPHM